MLVTEKRNKITISYRKTKLKIFYIAKVELCVIIIFFFKASSAWQRISLFYFIFAW